VCDKSHQSFELKTVSGFAGITKKSFFFFIFFLTYVWYSVKMPPCLPAGKHESPAACPFLMGGAKDLAEIRTS